MLEREKESSGFFTWKLTIDWNYLLVNMWASGWGDDKTTPLTSADIPVSSVSKLYILDWARISISAGVRILAYMPDYCQIWNKSAFRYLKSLMGLLIIRLHVKLSKTLPIITEMWIPQRCFIFRKYYKNIRKCK